MDRIKETADAFAAEGYIALAADLYSGRVGTSPQENMALVAEAQADPQEIIRNLNAAAGFLRDIPDVNGKIATIGWCFGGGVALSFAIGGENHDATAMFYGDLIDDPERLRQIQHEIYGTFAELDTMFPKEDVVQFAATLDSIGIRNDIHIYDDVNHGFWLYVDEDRQGRTEPALDAWQRLKAYLERTIAN